MHFRSRKRETPTHDGSGDRPESKKTKRHSLRNLLRSLRHKDRGPGGHGETGSMHPTSYPASLENAPSAASLEVKLSPSPERVGRFERVPEKPPSTAAAQIPTPPPTELSEDELQALFSGAPQFAVHAIHGRCQPVVEFPWDKELTVRTAADFTQLSHPAFSAATLRPHLPAPAPQEPHDKSTLQYDLKLSELPSMLCAQGVERGTVGFEYFLELPISDNLATEEEDRPNKSGLSEAARNNELLHTTPEKLGIRRLDVVLIQERLAELGDIYASFKEDNGKATILDIHKPGELYAELFGKFLSPPRFDPNTTDPTGLKVQIETLMNILKLKGIWCNFSLVEWRIKLGQLIWCSSDMTPEEYPSQSWALCDRDILLLQILLSSELLVRLDAVANLSTELVLKELHLTSNEVTYFHNIKTKKIDWDLVLARRFLENIQVIESSPQSLEPTPSSRAFSFLPSLGTQPMDVSQSGESEFIFIPRNQLRQFNGLFHFASAISWPNIESVQTQLALKLGLSNAPSSEGSSTSNDLLSPTSPSIYGTPLASPRSARSSYFGHLSPRPPLSRSSTQRSVRLHSPPNQEFDSAELGPSIPDKHIGGWLSRTYLMGLILPGETISHFLISTLLENDRDAMLAIGESANLYGGFIFAGRSWWSKNCIVGRVLACLDGSTECMGWLSVPVVPDAFKEGWVDVVSEPINNKRIKINEDDAVAQDASLWPSRGLGSISADELSLPLDPQEPLSGHIQVWEFSLKQIHATSGGDFSDPDEVALDEMVDEVGSYAANIGFLIPSDGTDERPLSLRLSHDIYFISSFPCTPPDTTGISQILPHQHLESHSFQGHPLHISYKYSIHSVKALLDPAFLLNSLTASAALEQVDEVFVLDARGGAALELLARAWCAEKGYNALIGRAERTCLSCCIREAKGLSVLVVIRV